MKTEENFKKAPYKGESHEEEYIRHRKQLIEPMKAELVELIAAHQEELTFEIRLDDKAWKHKITDSEGNTCNLMLLISS